MTPVSSKTIKRNVTCWNNKNIRSFEWFLLKDYPIILYDVHIALEYIWNAFFQHCKDEGIGIMLEQIPSPGTTSLNLRGPPPGHHPPGNKALLGDDGG